MTTPATPSSPEPTKVDRNLVVVDDAAVAPSFDYRLHQFWKNNGKMVLGACVVVLIAILAKGGYELYQAQQEKSIEEEYAAAATPDKLRAFAAAHAGHSLAGVAQLQMADEAYAAGHYPDALASYEKATAILKTGPLAARAQLGTAICQISSGKAADGEAMLKKLSSDSTQLKGIRAEATYELTSLAADAGRADDVAKNADLLLQIDPNSSWAQRAMMLRSTMTAPAATVKADAAAPAAQVAMPGKK